MMKICLIIERYTFFYLCCLMNDVMHAFLIMNYVGRVFLISLSMDITDSAILFWELGIITLWPCLEGEIFLLLFINSDKFSLNRSNLRFSDFQIVKFKATLEFFPVKSQILKSTFQLYKERITTDSILHFPQFYGES